MLQDARGAMYSPPGTRAPGVYFSSEQEAQVRANELNAGMPGDSGMYPDEEAELDRRLEGVSQPEKTQLADEWRKLKGTPQTVKDTQMVNRWLAKRLGIKLRAVPQGHIMRGARIPNPGSGKQLWEMTPSEYREYTDKGSYPFGMLDDAAERWMAIEDTRKRLVGPRSGKEILVASDKYGRNFEHRWIVESALREGLPVPPEALSDYPDLRAGNPGIVKRFLGGALRKASWVITFDELLAKTQAEMVRQGYLKQGETLPPGHVEALRGMYDDVAEAYRQSPEEVDKVLAAYDAEGKRLMKGGRHHNPIDLATVLAVSVLAGAVQGVVEPYVTKHVYGMGTKPLDIAENPSKLPGRSSLLTHEQGVFDHAGAPPWRAPVIARVSVVNEYGVPTNLRVETNRTENKWWLTRTLGKEATTREEMFKGGATLTGLWVTSSKRIADGWIAGIEDLGHSDGVADNPRGQRGYRKPKPPSTHLYEVWKVEPGAKDRVVSYMWFAPQAASGWAPAYKRDGFYLRRMDTGERVEPGVAGNPKTEPGKTTLAVTNRWYNLGVVHGRRQSHTESPLPVGEVYFAAWIKSPESKSPDTPEEPLFKAFSEGYYAALRGMKGNPGTDPRFFVAEDDWPLGTKKWWSVYDSVTGEKMSLRPGAVGWRYGSERLAQKAADKLNKEWAAGKIEVVAEGNHAT